MQNIIHATANEEEQMPDLPGFDDVLGGAFRLAVTVLICFTLPITFIVLRFFEVLDVPASALLATMVLGCLYFPMAFLAVAMKDTVLAANPLVVVPAMLKVPLGYLVTTIVVIGLYALRQFRGVAAIVAGGRGHLVLGERLSAHRQHADSRPALRHQQAEVRLVRPVESYRRGVRAGAGSDASARRPYLPWWRA
jgi:hypothetical protein